MVRKNPSVRISPAAPCCRAWIAAAAALVLSLGTVLGVTSWPVAGAASTTYVLPVEVQSVSESPASITFKFWRADHPIEVYRKAPDATAWGTKIATVAKGSTTWRDSTAALGTLYEYRFLIPYDSIYRAQVNGYILAGIRVDRTGARGRVVLVMPSSIQAPLATEIARFKSDLVGDGWTVHTVLTPDGSEDFSDPGFAHVAIRNDIKAIYNAYPGEVKQVILLGRVPQPRSGVWARWAPDGHSDLGANAADCYYADVDNTWTDLLKTAAPVGGEAGSVRAQWQNEVGDGRFDQSHFRELPEAFEMGWGRIDFRGINGGDEIGALRNYLNKLHAYKFAANGFKPGRKAAVLKAGAALQEEFWRSITPLVGMANNNYASAAAMPSVVWQPEAQYTYDNGPFLYCFAGGSQGANSQMSRAVFWSHWISHTGYWDINSSMRDRIAEPDSWTLSFTWSPPDGRYVYHKMGMGGTMGDVMKSTINNQSSMLGLYGAFLEAPLNSCWDIQGGEAGGDYSGMTFMGHMGDPTLRDSMVESVTGVRARLLSAVAQVQVEWAASPDALQGYHVFSAPSAAGPFTRLTATPVHVGATSGALAWTDPAPASDPVVYMVRALRLETSAGGSFLNASVGVMASADRSPDAFEISAAGLPDGFLGYEYSTFLETVGGNPPAEWAVASGSLPPGLALGSDGTLAGTPTQSGVFAFTLRATDLQGTVRTKELSIAIKEFSNWTLVTNGDWSADPVAANFTQAVAGQGWVVPPANAANWYRDSANNWGYTIEDGPNGKKYAGLGLAIADNKTTSGTVAFRFSVKNTDGTGTQNELYYRIYGINGAFSWNYNTLTGVPSGAATLLAGGMIRGTTDWKTISTAPLPVGTGYDYYAIRFYSSSTVGAQGDFLAVDTLEWASVPITYEVGFTAGPNGSLSGSLAQTVARGASTSAVEAVPAPGYELVGWTWSGGSFGANPLTIPNVTSDMALTANFQIFNNPPTCAISFPADNSSYLEGTPVSFAGTGSDVEDGVLATATWSSSISGTFVPVGGIYSGLGVGTHVITRSVTDSGGKTSSSSVTITIVKYEKPTVSAAASSGVVLEGSAGTFTFTRTGNTSFNPLTVNYVVSGTAIAGVDFPVLSGSVTIPVNESSATISVPALQDVIPEPLETIIVTTSSNASYTVAASPNNAATLTIRDDTETPMLTIAATDGSASEPAKGDGAGVFMITRAGSAEAALTVGLLAGGTASPGSDYITLPLSVTIPAGQASATISVVMIDDDEVEPDETVVVTLQPGAGYTVGTSASATVNAYDDEAAQQVRVEVGDAKCAEASTADPGTFILRRLGNRTSALAVNYTVSGTATNGTDYSALSGTATIAGGSGSATITVTPLNDVLVEGAETVVLTAAAGAGYTVVEPSSATIDIRDDEVVDVSVSVQDAVCIEKATADTGSFRLTRSASSASPLTVNYTIAGTATNGTDYSTLSGTATIPANATYVDVIVTPSNDALAEGPESVILTLGLIGSSYEFGDTRSQTLWIQDDESPSISVAATDSAAAEADGGTTNTGEFTFTVTSAPASDLTIPITIAGTAVNGLDYVRLPNSVLIPAGQTSASVTVTPVDDGIAEVAETVTLTLGQAPGYNIATTGTVTVNIAASDIPVANIVATDPAAAEFPTDTARFVVTFTSPPSGSTTIAYAVGGTATSGSDYTALGTISFSTGTTSTTITLTPLNDSDSEGPETATITLLPSASYTIGENSSATATINDDESDGTQTLVAAPPAVSVLEGSSATFTLCLGTPPAETTQVAVAFRSGDTDISLRSGASLTFTPADWNVPQTVTLDAAEDVDAIHGKAIFIVTSPARPSLFVEVTEIDNDTPPEVSITSPSTGDIALQDLTDSLVLVALATDTVGVPTVVWSQVSGPAGQQASFADAAASSTSVTFPAAGTYILRATASDGAQTSSADLKVVTGGSSGAYSGTDIGAVGRPGSFTAGAGMSYTINGEGPDISGTSDKCYFVSVPMSGNFTVSARVASQANSNVWAKAGLMVRESTAVGSRYVATLLTPGNGVRFQARTSLNASSSDSGTAGIVAPHWVRIVRNGTTLSGWRSADGVTWTQQGGNQTIAMTDTVMVGMVVTSNSASNLCQAVFDNLSGFPSPNSAPQVNPGVAPASTAGASADLLGAAADDSLPSGSVLATAWSMAAGPSTATFSNASSLASGVTFSAGGSYVLRLTASDGSATVFQDLAVAVTSSQTPFEKWTGEHGLNDGNKGDLADPDGDGVPNLMEYALGGHPGLAASAPRLHVSLPVASSPRLRMEVPRVADPSLTYEIWASDDIVNWGASPVWSSTGPANAGGTAFYNDSADPALQKKRFLRLRIIRN